MSFQVLFATVEAETTIKEQGLMDLLLDADPVVKATLIILIFFSVMSWAIILYKFRQISRAQKTSQMFWTVFAKAKNMDDAMNNFPAQSGPLFQIFNVGYDLFTKFSKTGKKLNNGRSYVEQRLAQAREEEMYKLEQHTPFLATTASTAPFIGLFGTVWGILTAFWAIGKAGSSSLATVGPYISEALVATAIGLAAAIPAVVAYNFFVHRIRIITKMMDLFTNDLVLKMEEEKVS